MEWKRPAGIPIHDNITLNYTVVINSTEKSDMSFVNVTSMTSLSISFIEEILTTLGFECVEFEFSVSGTNLAGTGPSTRINESLPISERI